jgi:conjugal transfer pilin signal peptidase TrbI
MIQNMFSTIRKRKKILTALVFGTMFWLMVVNYVAMHYSVGINVTPSLPYRFIVVKKDFTESDLKQKEVVSFIFGFDSKYDHYKKGAIFAKRLMCMPGDTLTTTGRFHFCNGFPLGSSLRIDSKGKPVTEHFVFNGVIPKEHYYVQGDHTHSYDSRYWGLIEKKQIIGVKTWVY